MVALSFPMWMPTTMTATLKTFVVVPVGAPGLSWWITKHLRILGLKNRKMTICGGGLLCHLMNNQITDDGRATFASINDSLMLAPSLSTTPSETQHRQHQYHPSHKYTHSPFLYPLQLLATMVGRTSTLISNTMTSSTMMVLMVLTMMVMTTNAFSVHHIHSRTALTY